jgi:hypothetical protein
LNQSLDYNWRAAEFFLDQEWTTVAFVRDPWWRAISMYHHQLLLGHLPLTMNYTNRSDFNKFVNEFAARSHNNGWSHTGSASNFCGLKYLKYDVYVDIDNIADGLQQLILKRPMFDSILNYGWENCTITGKKSLLEDQSMQDHAVLSFGSSFNKLREYDRLFCDNQTIESVYKTFLSDYIALEPTVGFKKHERCLYNVSNNSTLFFPNSKFQESLEKVNLNDLAECRLCGDLASDSKP